MGGYDSAQIADVVGLYILNTHCRIANPYKLDYAVFYTSPIVMVLSVRVHRKRLQEFLNS